MNMDFTFCCPTKIYFRNQGVSLIGSIIREDYHFSKVYLVYGGSSIKKSGVYDDVIASLHNSDIEFIEYGGIQANPDISDVRVMVTQAKEFRPDLILAVGGGSVIDAAKAVAHGYFYEGDPLDFNKHLVTPLHALPVATILTLSASGSEMSDSCVISDRNNNYKNGFNSITNYPLFSLLDPSLTLSVPMYHVGCGLADMFCHSFERYFSVSNEIEPADEMALGVMKSIVDTSKAVLADPKDIEARRDMMICGSLAHNGFTNFGKGKKFIVHRAEHLLSGVYPQLIHGQGIALLMVDYLKVNKRLFGDKIRHMGKVVFDCRANASLASIIGDLQSWINSLPIAHSFDELDFEISADTLKKAESILKVK